MSGSRAKKLRRELRSELGRTPTKAEYRMVKKLFKEKVRYGSH